MFEPAATLLRDVLVRAETPTNRTGFFQSCGLPTAPTAPSRNRRSRHRAHFPPPHGIQPRSPAGEGEAELERSQEKPSKNTAQGAKTEGVRGWPGRRESSWRQPPHLPRPPAWRSLPAAEPPMCAAQAAPPGPPPPPGAEARVADTAPQPGGHLHKGQAAGPA